MFSFNHGTPIYIHNVSVETVNLRWVQSLNNTKCLKALPLDLHWTVRQQALIIPPSPIIVVAPPLCNCLDHHHVPPENHGHTKPSSRLPPEDVCSEKAFCGRCKDHLWAVLTVARQSNWPFRAEL